MNRKGITKFTIYHFPFFGTKRVLRSGVIYLFSGIAAEIDLYF